MPRFLGFGPNLLIDIDRVQRVQYRQKDAVDPQRWEIVFDFNGDEFEATYDLDDAGWNRVWAFLVAQGLVVDV